MSDKEFAAERDAKAILAKGRQKGYEEAELIQARDSIFRLLEVVNWLRLDAPAATKHLADAYDRLMLECHAAGIEQPPKDLHLADAIEKYLVRGLDDLVRCPNCKVCTKPSFAREVERQDLPRSEW